ncbi:MAG: right-handed parallel beta-helix repeat-containing protein, partial [Bacteroidota bacterium]|nr:right-handed parallel beta-helix repeat-containing protein [Bacteroidota bacterium]
MKWLFLVAISFLFVLGLNAQNVYYVDYLNGSNSNNGTSSGTAWKTLDKAFSTINTNGATLNLSSGNHILNDEVIASGKDNLNIVGSGMGSTFLIPENAGDQGISITGSSGITISNLTFQNFAEDQSGAALDVTTSGTVTVLDVHFDNNSLTSEYDHGAAIFISNASTVEIDRCKFSNNDTHSSKSDGSCIYSEGSLTLKNSLFYDNDCKDNNGTSNKGNGEVFINDGTATITNCTFTENKTATAVIMCYAGITNIKNCLLTNNANTYSFKEFDATVNIAYSYFDDGTNAEGTNGFTLGSGNITAGTVGFKNAATNDFRIIHTSVCLNTGTSSGAPVYDFTNSMRNQDGLGYDIGCYEYICNTPQPGTISAERYAICTNTTASLETSGRWAKNIKWQESTNNASWSDVVGANNETFTSSNLTSSKYYRLAATCTGNYSDVVVSNVISLGVVSSGPIYVATTGDDLNMGTVVGQPKQTLEDALSLAGCAGSIIIASGTYNDDLLEIENIDGLTISGAGMGQTVFEQAQTGDRFMEI